MLKDLPKINVLIPTLNEEKRIKACLDAIIRQDYPKNKIKITIIDGCSNDSTIKIAKNYGCEILINDEILGEPGLHKGIKNSDCDLCCAFAADNIIANDKDFFNKMIIPFLRSDVTGAFPEVISSEDESAINKYLNYRSEPFSEFIYGDACNFLTFGNIYATKYEDKDYLIYDFQSNEFPLLALAQGFMINKRRFKRDSESRFDDIGPIVDIISSGEYIALVKTAKIFHYQMKDMKTFIKKFEWRIKNNIEKTNNSGTRTKTRKNYAFKSHLWIIYSISIFLPLFYSLYKILKTKKNFYIYHFITNTILLFLLPYTFVKLNLRKTFKVYK